MRWRAALRWRASRHRGSTIAGVVQRQPIAQRRLRDQHRRAGICQHEGEPLGRVVRVERQIGAAGLEDAEQPDQHLQRALDAQPHHHLGADPERAQMMRQLARARIELAVGEAARPRTPPRSQRASSCTCAANSSGRVADGTARAVSFQSYRMVRRSSGLRMSRLPIGAVGDPQPPPPAAGSAAPPSPPRSRARTGRWRIPECPRSPPARRPRRAARPGSPTGRTWRSRSRPARTRCAAPASSSRTATLFCNASITWNSGCRASERAGLMHLNQPLERQVLVAVGRQVGRPHPRDQLAEARIARGVRAQHQRVDEEAHEIVERAVGAARNRAADRDVAAAAQPREQRRKRRLQHHEQARPALAREPQQAAVQLRIERQPHAIAAMARHRRPRPVARQIDLIGKTLERIGPERELARDRALPIVLPAQHLVLPQRVVGILHRQGR